MNILEELALGPYLARQMWVLRTGYPANPRGIVRMGLKHKLNEVLAKRVTDGGDQTNSATVARRKETPIYPGSGPSW